MLRLARFAFAACVTAVIAAPAALAADYPIVVPEPMVIPPPPPAPTAVSGWYLRGDIGAHNQTVKSIDNVLFDDVAKIEFLNEPVFDSGGIGGLGIGFQHGFARIDLTGEYRGRSSFSALDRYDGDGDGHFDGTNSYTASKSEWLVLLNAYADLGVWNGFSPYVGAGIGAARVTIDGFSDVNVPNLGVAYAKDREGEWELAWALHAGLGYQVTDNLALDLSYRYVRLGDAETGDLVAFTGYNGVHNPMRFEDLASHDVRLGVRYLFGGEAQGADYVEPVVVKY